MTEMNSSYFLQKGKATRFQMAIILCINERPKYLNNKPTII